ncbi:MAG: heat shock protein HspQ [Opitutales bacterium]
MINLDESYAPITEPPSFEHGELVKHLKYDYRGVVVHCDPQCEANEAWYKSNQTQPAKDQPWYHVLVHLEAHVTYAAQCNLIRDDSVEAVLHPMVSLFFSGFENGRYLRNAVPWNPGSPPDDSPPTPPPAI